MNKQLTNISKFLSLVLRHQPELIGITPDEQGWVAVSDLLERVNGYGIQVDRPTLEIVVSTNDKQRFAFSEDGMNIRANQGHSISVDLALDPVEPPATLYHGTTSEQVAIILAAGLIRQKRHHVHLTEDRHTATKVGSRHGNAVILQVDAGAMHKAGMEFYCTANQVWLTEHVPPEFLRQME